MAVISQHLTDLSQDVAATTFAVGDHDMLQDDGTLINFCLHRTNYVTKDCDKSTVAIALVSQGNQRSRKWCMTARKLPIRNRLCD